ncbi:MAG: MFS transporter [Gammaproteobacteria bacterium]|nr:MFS transporter [Gammaproteobacteria bacterium]
MQDGPAIDAGAADTSSGEAASADGTRFRVLGAISFSHFLNDMIQSLIVAIYPLLKGTFALSFTQIGLITLTYQLCASMLQPAVGAYTDRHPQAHALSAGMSLTLAGLLALAFAPSYGWVLVAAALIGCGSAIFHPESSRIARLASGGRHGLAQSIFQVGGNTGSATGPLLAAWLIMPRGRGSVAWFAIAALVAATVLWNVGGWYRRQHLSGGRPARPQVPSPVPRSVALRSLAILLVLIFSKYFYLASIGSYYAFYLMHKFHLAATSAQIYLFVFLFAVALGTVFGGPVGDRIGRKRVIWASILGVAPFTLVLPYVDLEWTMILSFLIGLILASAFSAILVYAQELFPGKVGTISGLFFGLAFGVGGIGAAVLGALADSRGIEFVYRLCAFLPLLGAAAAFLPDIEHGRTRNALEPAGGPGG